MKAWQIFIHSVRQVFGNFTDALRISGLIFIAQMMVVVALGLRPTFATATDTPMTTGGMLVILGVMLVMLTGSFWVAVAWHRFVLAQESKAGLLPPFHGALIWRYFWRTLGIAAILMLVGVVIGMLLGLVVMPLLGGIRYGGLLIPLLLAVPMLTVMYRFSTALPGLALGHELGFSAGWAATAGETGTMLQLAAISGVAGLLLGVPNLMLPEGSILMLLWDVVGGWLQLMVGVSILTTLYGHYIEKRPLV